MSQLKETLDKLLKEHNEKTGRNDTIEEAYEYWKETKQISIFSPNIVRLAIKAAREAGYIPLNEKELEKNPFIILEEEDDDDEIGFGEYKPEDHKDE